MAVPKAKVKKKEHEKLSDANVARVIDLLEATPPISKKIACEILNISYNTVRLSKIIEEYKDNIVQVAKRKAANRGKPAEPHEIQTVIQGYLDGDPISKMADILYRSASFIKDLIDNIGVPTRGGGYFETYPLPEQCVADNFEVGQVIWSTKHDRMAIVRRELAPGTTGNKRDYLLYDIYVIESIDEPSPYFPLEGYGGFHSTQAVYDLGNLNHLKEYGVDVYRPYRAYFKEWLSGR